jgi:hypothetical protein
MTTGENSKQNCRIGFRASLAFDASSDSSPLLRKLRSGCTAAVTPALRPLSSLMSWFELSARQVPPPHRRQPQVSRPISPWTVCLDPAARNRPCRPEAARAGVGCAPVLGNRQDNARMTPGGQASGGQIRCAIPKNQLLQLRILIRAISGMYG